MSRGIDFQTKHLPNGDSNPMSMRSSVTKERPRHQKLPKRDDSVEDDIDPDNDFEDQSSSLQFNSANPLSGTANPRPKIPRAGQKKYINQHQQQQQARDQSSKNSANVYQDFTDKGLIDRERQYYEKSVGYELEQESEKQRKLKQAKSPLQQRYQSPVQVSREIQENAVASSALVSKNHKPMNDILKQSFNSNINNNNSEISHFNKSQPLRETQDTFVRSPNPQPNFNQRSNSISGTNVSRYVVPAQQSQQIEYYGGQVQQVQQQNGPLLQSAPYARQSQQQTLKSLQSNTPVVTQSVYQNYSSQNNPVKNNFYQSHFKYSTQPGYKSILDPVNQKQKQNQDLQEQALRDSYRNKDSANRLLIQNRSVDFSHEAKDNSALDSAITFNPRREESVSRSVQQQAPQRLFTEKTHSVAKQVEEEKQVRSAQQVPQVQQVKPVVIQREERQQSPQRPQERPAQYVKPVFQNREESQVRSSSISIASKPKTQPQESSKKFLKPAVPNQYQYQETQVRSQVRSSVRPEVRQEVRPEVRQQVRQEVRPAQFSKPVIFNQQQHQKQQQETQVRSTQNTYIQELKQNQVPSQEKQVEFTEENQKEQARRLSTHIRENRDSYTEGRRLNRESIRLQKDEDGNYRYTSPSPQKISTTTTTQYVSSTFISKDQENYVNLSNQKSRESVVRTALVQKGVTNIPQEISDQNFIDHQYYTPQELNHQYTSQMRNSQDRVSYSKVAQIEAQQQDQFQQSDRSSNLEQQIRALTQMNQQLTNKIKESQMSISTLKQQSANDKRQITNMTDQIKELRLSSLLKDHQPNKDYKAMKAKDDQIKDLKFTNLLKDAKTQGKQKDEIKKNQFTQVLKEARLQGSSMNQNQNGTPESLVKDMDKEIRRLTIAYSKQCSQIADLQSQANKSSSKKSGISVKDKKLMADMEADCRRLTIGFAKQAKENRELKTHMEKLGIELPQAQASAIPTSNATSKTVSKKVKAKSTKKKIPVADSQGSSTGNLTLVASPSEQNIANLKGKDTQSLQNPDEVKSAKKKTTKKTTTKKTTVKKKPPKEMADQVSA